MTIRDESDGAETRRRCYATTPGLLEMKETDTLDPALLLLLDSTEITRTPTPALFFFFFFTASQSEDSDVHVELEN